MAGDDLRDIFEFLLAHVPIVCVCGHLGKSVTHDNLPGRSAALDSGGDVHGLAVDISIVCDRNLAQVRSTMNP